MLWARRIPPIPSLLSTALCCQKWCLLFLSTFATELFLSALFVSTVGEAKREAEARASEAISSGNFRSVCVRIDSRDSLFTISMHSYYCLAPMRIMTAHSQCNDECAGPHREEEDCVVPKEKFEERPDGRHAYEEAQRP